MANGTSILIIEDTEWDYKEIYNFLTGEGYTCYPQEENFNKFITNLQNYLKPSNQTIKQDATNYLQHVCGELSPKLIILDVQLLPTDNDRSGLIFLEFLRKKYPYIPILVLTIHRFDDVTTAFQTVGGVANYFLSKILEDDNLVLSKEFFQKRLHPVIMMLLYWYGISTSGREILDAINSNQNELFSFLDKKFGLLQFDINKISDNIEHLKNYTDVLLRLVQYNISQDDKKAAELVENFIEEFSLITDVPKISENKPKMIELLKKAKDEFKEHILKKEIVAKDIAEILTRTFKEIIGAEEDESIIKAGLFSICKAVGRTWKFYRTGEF